MPATRIKRTATHSPAPAHVIGVLVVDDDELVRIMLRSGLERNGFAVWLAAGADEAVAIYRNNRDRVSVVLLDVRMPDRDGPQVLRELRAVNPELRACFVSGDTGGYRAEELTAYGTDCLVAKPFLLNDRADTLRRVAAR